MLAKSETDLDRCFFLMVVDDAYFVSLILWGHHSYSAFNDGLPPVKETKKTTGGLPRKLVFARATIGLCGL